MRAPLRVAVASAVGTTIEWYDFFLYGTAAALVFRGAFFPEYSDTAGRMAAFTTFAVGFAARPLGGLVFGHLGDRVGRRTTLVLTLLLMGFATVLIAAVPTYGQIGLAAPVLLTVLRLLQGLAVGGEWGNAVTLAVEHAPASRRGLYGSAPQIGAALGLVLSTGAFAAASAVSGSGFATWGWRLPFLLSAVLVAVGLLIRAHLPESPLFRRVDCAAPDLPDVRRRDRRTVALAAGAFVCPPAVFYVITVFGLAHATEHLGVPRQTFLTAVLLGAVLECVALPAFGALSDRIGRRAVYALGLGTTALWAFPAGILIGTGSAPLVQLAVGLAIGVGHAAAYASAAAFFTELFDTAHRCRGASLGYQIGALIGGGLVPLLTAALVAGAGGAWWPAAVVLVGSASLSLACLAALRETKDVGLADLPRLTGIRA